MKNYLITILFLLVSNILIAQIKVTGTVIAKDDKAVLEGASVYFNNTTIGTVAGINGDFELKAKAGSYELVISFLGYKTKVISIKESVKLAIVLEPDNNMLNEVKIVKTIYDEDWKYNLSRFKQTFFGRAALAESCIIINPKTLHFDFDYKTNTLTAFAREPLQIKHKGLGYLITYDLIDYKLTKSILTFSGFARYQELRKKTKEKWLVNREMAFKGSKMHFLRSLQQKTLKDEGFVVNQFKRVVNPERPSEEKIKLARELIKLYSGKVNFNKKIKKPLTALDSALVVLRKVSLPKYRDYLYKTKVPYNEMLLETNAGNYINFENYLSVTYLNEPEELNYLKGTFGRRQKASGVQSSSIVLLEGKLKLYPSGIVEAPTTLFNEGYWGFEAFATMLPLDYSMPKNEK